MLLEADQKEELNIFNERWDHDFYEITNKYEDLKNRLKIQQEQELQEKVEDFEKYYHQYAKPSTEVLNTNKILESAIKQKEYINFVILAI